MSSMTDLDQGGTSRQFVKANLGPTFGFVNVPLENIAVISLTGTYFLDPSVSRVEVNVNAAVTINLPNLPAPPVPAQTGLFARTTIEIIDILGTATLHNITILPQVNWLIAGAGNKLITTNFGAVTLAPNFETRQWIPI